MIKKTVVKYPNGRTWSWEQKAWIECEPLPPLSPESEEIWKKVKADDSLNPTIDKNRTASLFARGVEFDRKNLSIEISGYGPHITISLRELKHRDSILNIAQCYERLPRGVKEAVWDEIEEALWMVFGNTDLLAQDPSDSKSIMCGRELDWESGRIVWKSELQFGEVPPPREMDSIFANRYLCRGGGLLLVGPSGIGKSSFSMQIAVSFAIGKSCFGFEPMRPTKTLVIQAENDIGDIYEQQDGMFEGIGLSDGDIDRVQKNVTVCTVESRTSDDFIEKLEDFLKRYGPDMVIIDPLLSYIDGDISRAGTVMGFLRKGISPLIKKYECAVILCHHTGKPPRELVGQKFKEDSSYAGMGSSDLTNWCRGAVTIKKTRVAGCFELVASKRAGRLKDEGWVDSPNEPGAKCRVIKHGSVGICWEDASQEETRQVLSGASSSKQKTSITPEHVMSFVPADEPIKRTTIVALCQNKVDVDCKSKNFIESIITLLVHEGRLHEVKIHDGSTKPFAGLSRKPEKPQKNAK